MPVSYYLQPNPVTPDPDDQSARVVTADNLTADERAAELIKRGNASNKAQALAIINGFMDITAEKVAVGMWHVEVCRTYGTTAPVLRTGQLSAVLTVA